MSETLAAATTLIMEAAKLLGTDIQEAPMAWIGDRFNTELLAAIDRGRAPDRSDRDLPKSTHGLILDGTPVLVGEFESRVRRLFHDTLRRYRNQAAIARSWLGPQAPNLQVFLIGPTGTSTDGTWRQLAAEAEIDDRVCRKLVWLLPESPTTHDATVFLSRTFLARPWEHGPQTGNARLDRMSNIDLPSGWTIVVDDDDFDVDSLVARLIKLGEGNVS